MDLTTEGFPWAVADAEGYRWLSSIRAGLVGKHKAGYALRWGEPERAGIDRCGGCDRPYPCKGVRRIAFIERLLEREGKVSA